MPQWPARPALFQPNPLPDLEQRFQRQYADAARQYDLNPDPDGQFYDYRSALAHGATPDASGHWPSTYKQEGHPNLVVGGFNTTTGEPVPGQTPATAAELKRLGWDDAFANAHGSDVAPLRNALIQRERR